MASSGEGVDYNHNTVGVQRITKLTVRIVSRFLSHGTDHFRINNNNKDNKTNVTLNKIFKCVKTKYSEKLGDNPASFKHCQYLKKNQSELLSFFFLTWINNP